MNFPSKAVSILVIIGAIQYKEDMYFSNTYLFLTLKSGEEPGGICHVLSWEHQEKIYFVTWTSEAKDTLDMFCQLRRQSFGQLAFRDT